MDALRLAMSFVDPSLVRRAATSSSINHGGNYGKWKCRICADPTQRLSNLVIDDHKVSTSKSCNDHRRTKLQRDTREDSEKCLRAAPGRQWRAMIALARFGGLRTPSNLVRLR